MSDDGASGSEDDAPVDLWSGRDLPVLRAVTRAIDEGRAGISADVIAGQVGLNVQEVVRAAAALQRSGLVKARVAQQQGRATFHDVDGDAYRLVGLYPDPGSDVGQLVDVLRRALESAEPQERRHLQAVLDGVLNLPTSVVAGMLGIWAAARWGAS